VQIIDGRLYIAGMGKYNYRVLNVQRQLLAVSKRWRLPDVDMVLEQGDL